LKKSIPPEPVNNAPRVERDAYSKYNDDSDDVTCLMLTTMNYELQKQFEDVEAYDMILYFKEMFQEQAQQERFESHKALNACKMVFGTRVSAHVLKMKGYLDHLEKFGTLVNHDMATDFILGSLPPEYNQFVMNFNMHNIEKSITELHGRLKQAKQNIKKNTPNVLMVQKGKGKKNNWKGKATANKGKDKAKSKFKPKPKAKISNEGVCHHCGEPGHWLRNCKLYLGEKKKKDSEIAALGIHVIEINLSISNSLILDISCGSHICVNVKGLKRTISLAKGEVDLQVANGAKVTAIGVGTFELIFPSGLVLELNNCFYIPAMSRNNISVSYLDFNGFEFVIWNNICSINKNDIFYGDASLLNGLYILNFRGSSNKVIYNINTKRLKSNDLSQTFFWHCRLGHINEKRISKLHNDGLLNSFDLDFYETCDSCLLGKMTTAHFKKQSERDINLLDLIHTNVCGPLVQY
jgi:hypothetical protein